ncbi:MAG: zinc metallopeptidase [Lachnospiraceae bacterium]|jgi:Zn-dependent membrane protease YugP|nr:zinc metallopeptidase [Lachnospiraceae bacterium]MDE6921892.1 zinc metallopeptidase [Lachnospiraceae bacterium]MDE6940971.1 zinc metallopeptidase [Lachnospiraceae bacterium]MDE6999020.1 zinc metallopeptidase [Lachnospiraceae bacterium]
MPFFYGYHFDPTYILVLIGAVLSIIASARVNSTFNKYARVRSMSGMTGAQTAEAILRSRGIYDVQVEHIRGNLTDHYDPSKKVVRLSDSVYNATSVAAIGVAAHECGHVMQHHEKYAPLSIRTRLVPAANIGSRLGIPIVILGLILGSNSLLINIGIWVFSLAVLFQIVTLPVEFDASRRALACIEQYGIVTSDERAKSAKVLRAAAYTYVAAAAASILQLLRLVMLSGRRSD